MSRPRYPRSFGIYDDDIERWVYDKREADDYIVVVTLERDSARRAWDDLKETSERLEFELEIQNDLTARAYKLILTLQSMGKEIGGVYESAEQWLKDYDRIEEEEL